MYELEVRKYKMLNEFAGNNGVVVMGGSEDMGIPMGELKQAFDLDVPLYNRSFAGLKLCDTASLYDSCIAPICPDAVLLHIGCDGMEAAEYLLQYEQLIRHIHKQDPRWRIGVIPSEKNSKALNDGLKTIAQTLLCEYIDLFGRRSWNPKESQSVASFLYSTGFIRPLKARRPLYDLACILFCCNHPVSAMR